MVLCEAGTETRPKGTLLREYINENLEPGVHSVSRGRGVVIVTEEPGRFNFWPVEEEEDILEARQVARELWEVFTTNPGDERNIIRLERQLGGFSPNLD